jgi:hypothetical protein
MENINTNFIEIILPILAIILILFIVIKIFTLPINIANNKNLASNEITTIRILTWCGLFAGITWFIALCLALSYKEQHRNY